MAKRVYVKGHGKKGTKGVKAYTRSSGKAPKLTHSEHGKEYTAAKSSLLKAVNYDADTNDLHVTFGNGQKYVYADVPEHHYNLMRKHKAPGKYFYHNIRSKYSYTKL